MSDNVIQLVHSAGEARVDSRVIAEQLGVKHKHSFALVTRYQRKFEELGQLPFKRKLADGPKAAAGLSVSHC